MQFIKLINLIIFLKLTSAISLKHKRQHLIQPASRAISKLIDDFSEKYHMRFRIVTLKGDRYFKDSRLMANNVLKLSKYPVVIDEFKMKEFIAFKREVPQIVLISFEEMIMSNHTYQKHNSVFVNRTYLDLPDSIERRLVTYAPSITLFYTYWIERNRCQSY